MADPKITETMREVLGELCAGPSSAEYLGYSTATFDALSRRGLIRVDSGFPRKRANAQITDDGRRMAGRRI